MKKFYFVPLLFVFSLRSFSQLIPSTIGEIYNFGVGDSLEYEFSIYADDQSHSYLHGYVLFVITNGSQNLTNVFYQYTRDVHYTSVSNPLNYPPYASDPPFIYSLNTKDSSVLYQLILTDTMCSPKYDSVYVNQQFNGRKQNESYRMCFESTWGQQFADSLGQVSRSAGHTNGGAQWEAESQSLIYYHKANGDTWGTPQYFVLNGIDDMEESPIKIFPNPTSSTFQIKLFQSPHQQTLFKLYDALGREVKQELLSSITTTLNRENLNKGIYFWQIETGRKILERGKIIFQ